MKPQVVAVAQMIASRSSQNISRSMKMQETK
jgi:hypothetical protein